MVSDMLNRLGIKPYAKGMLLCCLCMQFAVFYGTRLLLPNPVYHDFSVAIDARLPFWPAFIYIYVLAYVYWGVSYIFISGRGRGDMKRLFFATITGQLVCAVCFLLIPSTMTRAQAVSGVGAWLTKLIYAADTPDNLLPSMHCLMAWFSFRPLVKLRGVPFIAKIASFIFAVLVCLSTLFVKQHVFMDAVTGVALAEICWQLSKIVFPRGRDGNADEPKEVEALDQ